MGQDSDVSRQPSPVKNCANRRRQNPVGFQLKGFEKSALVFLFQNCFLCLFLLDFCRNGIVASQKTGQGARFNITTAFKSNSNSNASLFSTSSFLQPQQDEPHLIQEEEVFHLLLKERVMGHTPLTFRALHFTQRQVVCSGVAAAEPFPHWPSGFPCSPFPHPSSFPLPFCSRSFFPDPTAVLPLPHLCLCGERSVDVSGVPPRVLLLFRTTSQAVCCILLNSRARSDDH